MSSLRYQEMTSWGFYSDLICKVRAANIGVDTKIELLRELQQYGPQAGPKVARKLKQARKKFKGAQ